LRVLDIDLDAFLNGTAVMGANAGQRLNGDDYVPWTPAEVRAFLEGRCGLSTSERRRGASFEHHHEAFFYWQRLIDAGTLTAPFDVVHVDAHSDLSTEGSGGHIYLLTELLSYPIQERGALLDPSRVTFANYPAFAAALGWLRSFTWVRPPTGDNGILQFYVGNDAIHLKHYPVSAFVGGLDPFAWRHVQPLTEDDPIPASVITTDDYSADTQFDFVTVCRSPQFTPDESDSLFELIRGYINEHA
jgi:hypothetical protein